MSIGKTLIRGGATLLLLPLGLIVGLLLINLHDEPPSEAVLALRAAVNQRPAIAEADNAYFLAQGFAAPADADPLAEGRRRDAWNRSVATLPWGHQPAASVAREPFRSARPAAVTRLAEACRNPVRACLEALGSSRPVLADWLEREGWLLARYRRLLAHPHWQEALSLDPRVEFPPYADILEAQQLYLLQQWQQAQALTTPGRLAEALQQDLLFWRRTLAEADSLITKLIAAAAIRSHFQWAGALQASLPAAAQARAVPPAWQRPLDEAERSMRRALAGEALMMDALAQRSIAGEPVLQPFGETGEDGDWRQALARHAAGVLLQPQDMSNRRSELLLALATELDVEQAEFPAALARATALEARAMDEVFDNPLYNPVGSLLLSVGSPDLSAYASRVFDLEGARRAALLAAGLRGEGRDPEQLPAALAEAALRDPYSGAAFAWDAGERAIRFDGLAEGDRGQIRIPY